MPILVSSSDGLLPDVRPHGLITTTKLSLRFSPYTHYEFRIFSPLTSGFFRIDVRVLTFIVAADSNRVSWGMILCTLSSYPPESSLPERGAFESQMTVVGRFFYIFCIVHQFCYYIVNEAQTLIKHSVSAAKFFPFIRLINP